MRCGDRQHQSAIFATFIYDVRARKFMDILLVTVVLTQLIIIKCYCLLLRYLSSAGVIASEGSLVRRRRQR